ncbi:murein L,D-transpeptidase catalytic domain family protein [Flavobacterium silvaticum]|uniref:Murein L,D-transpeptidase catalytic domain family protein n=1 Tax=Flavobacterium silvaticum TaxID=1852020 RepID=A0A972JHU1_9FLAO|nr:murein L,D-transpeptidase catalytic domain family protein [Flavobacterium silvaticum]NMH27493.1 murein L,D-transpeptidase catalytic domain family protein [Flavobacterium silvaticum]
MIYKLFPALLLLVLSFSPAEKALNAPKTAIATNTVEAQLENVYSHLDAGSSALPQKASFFKALQGFYKLKAEGKVTKDILTLVDFSMSSNSKRLWVIDLVTNKVLFNSLVAHGRNSGDEFALNFSNKGESNMSSLGFFTTGEVYRGKHGMSLKLDGLQKGLNDHARSRAVVMHGADYVCDSFIKNHHRLGRSQGCPAIPQELVKDIIGTIKGKSCLFIYHPSGDSSFSKLFS